ncbi:hypothetical protein M378DRAFT_15139 [Amanita muscaria Koide BX008]|uniref:HNH nuclease domain-containing protein n=1 Tax=Amanita muscaria (strain Koide BX008) TaxID=946122 RepID=A0A0C2WRX3_AMAMK|nr:hypothetical protein M378DRAFT_15139 [Amanita muscaria Koide BX008]
MSTPSKAQLWLSLDNVARLALSIPLAECSTFAVNPLKWLRFLGFTIYGREGYLSTSKDGPEIDDYTANIEARSYYFVSEGEARLVDVDAMDDRTSDARWDDSYSDESYLTNRRRDFSESVVARDGTCVITGDIEQNCIACHILPHSKGSNYILNIVHHRGGTDDSADGLNDINDTRNGLLLINFLHRPFGAGKLAFLKTPNFALTVDDIPYHQPKEADGESPASRLTLHHFVDSPLLGVVIPKFAPHNSDARQPQDTSKWPPAIIVDLFYATAALNAWSPKSFLKYVRKRSRDAYYDDDQDGGNALDGSGPSHVDAQMGDQASGHSGSEHYRKKPSNITTRQLEKRRVLDLLDGVSALWMRTSRVDKPKPEGVCAADPARNESVKKWLQSMEDSIN